MQVYYTKSQVRTMYYSTNPDAIQKCHGEIWSVAAFGEFLCECRIKRFYLHNNLHVSETPPSTPLYSQPQTPNLEDDLNEVMLREAGIELVTIQSTPEPRRKSMVGPDGLCLLIDTRNADLFASTFGVLAVTCLAIDSRMIPEFVNAIYGI